MYYNLIDKVYWGDWKSVYQLKYIVGSVICVAGNQEMVDGGYSPLVLPHSIPYFRLAERDRAFPTDAYFETMYHVIRSFKRANLPLLVHCYMGIHRSPIVAIMAALALENDSAEYYKFLLTAVENIIPDFKETRKFNYSVAAQGWIERRLLSTSPQKI
jgi:hypothetical protein